MRSAYSVARSIWHRFLAYFTSPSFILFLGRLLCLFKLEHSSLCGFPDVKSAKRILVIRFDGMGDLVMISGFLRELRSSAPHAKIGLLIREEFRDLIEHCPYIDEIYTFALKPHKRFALLRWEWEFVKLCHTEIWKIRYDLLLLPQTAHSFFETRIMALLTLCPIRASWSDPNQNHSSQEKEALRLLNVIVPMPLGLHESEKGYRFLEAVGGRALEKKLELWWDDETNSKMDMQCRDIKGRNSLLVALGISASQPNKIWPANCFIELGRRLREQCDARMVAIAGPEAIKTGAIIASALNGAAVNLAGTLSKAETAAFLSKCDLFIGNDSGPMHLAAASGIPVIMLSGLPANGPNEHNSSPVRIGPFCKMRTIIQPDNSDACNDLDIKRITIDQVMNAVELLLAQKTNQKSCIVAL